MTDVGSNLEVREFSVRTPGRIEHIGVRRRDWDEIKEDIGSCQKGNGWLGNCAWTMVGGTIGGILGMIALSNVAQASTEVWTLFMGATFVMFFLGSVTFVLDHQLGKNAQDAVDKLRQKMDSIVEESDRKDAI